VTEYISANPNKAEAEEQQRRMSNKRTKVDTIQTPARRFTVPVAPPVKKFVKGCMERAMEKKFLNQAIAITDIAAGGTLQQAALFNIVQGTTDSTRVGNVIRVRSIRAHLTFTDTVMTVFRILLIWDRQPNGAAAAVADVVATATFNGLYNTNNVVGAGGSRFTIISDVTGIINPNIVTTNTPYQYNRTFLVNKSVTFGGNAGTIADMSTNNLFFLFFASSANTDLSGNLQIKYTDD